MNEDDDDLELGEYPVALPEDEPENLADPQQQRRRKARIDQDREQELAFWTKALSEPTGRRCLWGILKAGHFGGERFATTAGLANDMATWFRAGNQAVVQEIYDSWELISFEGVHRMRLENDPRFAKPKAKR